MRSPPLHELIFPDFQPTISLQIGHVPSSFHIFEHQNTTVIIAKSVSYLFYNKKGDRVIHLLFTATVLYFITNSFSQVSQRTLVEDHSGLRDPSCNTRYFQHYNPASYCQVNIKIASFFIQAQLSQVLLLYARLLQVQLTTSSSVILSQLWLFLFYVSNLLYFILCISYYCNFYFAVICCDFSDPLYFSTIILV